MELTKFEEDEGIQRLLAEGWRFHSNYKTSDNRHLEDHLRYAPSFSYHPRLADKVLFFSRAYDVSGEILPSHKAIYLRSFNPIDCNDTSPENPWVP